MDTGSEILRPGWKPDRSFDILSYLSPASFSKGNLELTSCLPGRPKLRTVARIFVPEPLEGTVTDTITSQDPVHSWSTASPQTKVSVETTHRYYVTQSISERAEHTNLIASGFK